MKEAATPDFLSAIETLRQRIHTLSQEQGPRDTPYLLRVRFLERELSHYMDLLGELQSAVKSLDPASNSPGASSPAHTEPSTLEHRELFRQRLQQRMTGQAAPPAPPPVTTRLSPQELAQAEAALENDTPAQTGEALREETVQAQEVVGDLPETPNTQEEPEPPLQVTETEAAPSSAPLPEEEITFPEVEEAALEAEEEPPGQSAVTDQEEPPPPDQEEADEATSAPTAGEPAEATPDLLLEEEAPPTPQPEEALDEPEPEMPEEEMVIEEEARITEQPAISTRQTEELPAVAPASEAPPPLATTPQETHELEHLISPPRTPKPPVKKATAAAEVGQPLANPMPTVPLQEIISPSPPPPAPPAAPKLSQEALGAIFRFVNLSSDLGPLGLERVVHTFLELCGADLQPQVRRLKQTLLADQDPQHLYQFLKETVADGLPVSVLFELGGLALEDQERLEEALDMLETAAALAGEDPQHLTRAHYLLGVLYLRHGALALGRHHLSLADRHAPREGLLRVIIGYKLRELAEMSTGSSPD